MSKSLKKLIDINRLREFKNKLVGAGSAYVQTTAVDQTIAGTKTFSKPIVGSVTGSSGSCTGNAATATKATQDSDGNKINTTYSKNGHTHDDRYYTETEVNNLLNGKANTSGTYSNLTVGNAGSATNATYANWLRTASHPDYLFRTEWDGAYFWTYVKDPAGSYVAVRVARSDSAANAEACTGNAATATKATKDSAGQQINTTYIKGLAVSGRTITYTKGNGSTGTITTQDTNTWTAFKGATSSANGTAGYVPAPTKGNQAKFFKADGTWATPPNTTYALMSASEATTGTATAARTISAKVLHDKINSNLSAYATKTELNNGLTTKANNSEVVHKSGNESIAGTKTFKDRVHANNGFHSTTNNVLTAQAGEYTFLLRIDSNDTYLLMSDKGGVPGTWSSARPLTISNSTGVCNINGNAATATRATNADHATKADSATKAASADRASAANCVISNSRDSHEIRFDWDRQVSGCVGLRVDATDMGGIVTTSNAASYNTGGYFIGFYSSVSRISNIGNGGRLTVGATTSASNLYDTITTANSDTVVCSRNITLAGVWKLISIIKRNVFSENYVIVESTHQAGNSFASGVVAVQGLFVRVS